MPSERHGASAPPSSVRDGGELLWVPVARALADRIVAGIYPPDSMIPTEHDLGREFGVSRTVVRESVKAVVQMGLLRIHRGRGTIAEHPTRWRSIDPMVLAARMRHGDAIAVLRELFVVRKGLEPELAAIAAERATETEIAAIGTNIEDLSGALADLDSYRVADAAFHDAIITAAHVSLAQGLMRSLGEPLDVGRRLTNRLPGNVGIAHEQHLEVYRAIVDRDPTAARAAMRRHIEWADEHLDRTG